MYKLNYLIGGAALVLATSALAGGPEVAPAPAAAPVETSGFYVGVNGGLSLFPNYSDTNNNFPNGNLVIPVNGINAVFVPYSYQTAGWNAGASFGYRWNAWRAELEGSYMQQAARNAARNQFIPGFGTYNLKNLQILTVLANGYYDFDLGNNFVPYVGLGLGWGQTKTRFAFIPVNLNNSFNSSSTRNGFAFQGVLGLDYKITDNVRLGLSYHAVGITGGSNNNRVITLNNTNNIVAPNNGFLFENKINLGLSYFF